MAEIQTNSLVLYKKKPARVKRIDAKLHLELVDGEKRSVRQKDVLLLHVGPISRLSDLQNLRGEIDTAWELLAGSSTSLADLSELVFGAFSPDTAWSTWKLVQEGILFDGTPDMLQPVSPEAVKKEMERLRGLEAERASWEAFVQRLSACSYASEDRSRLEEIESLANGSADRSPSLSALGRDETVENAHQLLLEIGFWDAKVNPHPQRAGVVLAPPITNEQNDFQPERRTDLTHLQSFAIDDADTTDPDDALSLDGDRLWVHVADAAAIVAPESALDLAARERVASLYLPEGTVPMLPRSVVDRLGLGLQSESNALSFGIELDSHGAIAGFDFVLSRIRVQRMTYAEVEARLNDEPFRTLNRRCALARQRRWAAGAIDIDLPDVRLRYRNDLVEIEQLSNPFSRDLISTAMLLAGEAVAQFGLENRIPLPFSTQEPAGDIDREEEGLAGMFQRRKSLKRSLIRSFAAPHAGTGLDAYVQATSPMRRYMDLVTHQQLRAHLEGKPEINEQQLAERLGATSVQADAVRKAERASNLHWTLVYLLQHPGWQGEGIVVEQNDGRQKALIPELGIETGLFLGGNVRLNQKLLLRVSKIDIPHLDARFEVLQKS